MSNKVFYGIIAVIVVAVIGGVIVSGGGKKKEDVKKIDIAAVTEKDHAKGAENPKVTLIEYGDFQCPFCGVVHPTLNQVLPEYKDSVKFVYRHFPITNIHPNTLVMHRAAEAASNQDKFFELYDMIYENQQEWSESKNPLEIVTGYAKQIGLDVDQFKKDINSVEVADRVREVKNEGEKAGVESTPTFFVNGNKVDAPRSADELREILDKALKDANK
ncbi:DsbA family protein [Candidatus Saccharibacteria bacterium]|jgi:protein-disulfide isomerase|nr:DsbA family protein [Candidatus Saccharibacteria bacterium]MBP9131922.1 DsbA family protein [Candidatus Saccharibacteria bacterium]